VSSGDLTFFFKRPIPAILFGLALILILSSIFSSAKRKKLLEKIEQVGGDSA
jgi:TctA family transporter